MTICTCTECHTEIQVPAHVAPGQSHRFYCSVCERPVEVRAAGAPGAGLEGSASPSPRILVVDDTATVRATVADQLRAAGFEVETAADGNEALACIGSFHPDLVLLDLVMPGKDGFDVLESLERLPERPAVLVISGAVRTAETIQKAHALGAAGFIPKTALRDTLLFRVRNTLDSPTAAGGAA